ncbi:HD domain-containing phosphohydrolase [Marinobacter zhanjiangensis]|uniref:Two-component system response regulator n=1 Tax=Marinobacter zhanjiangensis TaxID=578215 RepID=A0ABQ3AKQ8_9GAMM|nr:HD domain-containing phosphohydrolase [Marinobacter zhanjiangensis]GGY59849.1 two-component system response regulator [Marinobacter zhanjiangensis]
MSEKRQQPENAQKLPDNLRVLLVDDEENILRSLKRLLRREPYEVVTAESGDAAIGVLENERVDLIISDARMPGMDGPTLLSTARRRWPWIVRILLTGYADMNSTIKAINDGRIYQYISKPWEDDDLRTTIQQALAFQYSERRRLALEKLARKQNRELKTLNETLEQKVAARTTELQQTTDMLDETLAELRKSYVTTTGVFASLFNQRLPADLQTNAQVSSLARAVAAHLEMEENATRDLEMAAALYNLGKLAWSDEMLRAPSDKLTREQDRIYRRYPEAGEQLLMALDPLQGAAALIRHQRERWDGRGYPDELEGEAIPLGARILRLTVDFIEMQAGLVVRHKMPREDAIRTIKRQGGRLYQPELCETFTELLENNAPDLYPEDDTMIAVPTHGLEPGMVLARDLHAASGMLLLNEGKELTERLIDKLIAFEKGEPRGTRYTLFICKSDDADGQNVEAG